ncbi:hypothetical protein [Hyphomicrobium sp.]|uniref:hypothetical protein n=1 Tax=Hyphomicrobium sp. TaxID=82 RepID=UPI002D77303E|nr:hypothetical protein [Hyphomicrobium sp.]HET6390142.1 hypothetical protein [Hyphomicrobium sp.]
MAAPGPSAMASPDFEPLLEEDTEDLPRTLRREKEARARQARERAMQERAAAPSLPLGSADRRLDSRLEAYAASDTGEDEAKQISAGGVVRRFDVPFVHLVSFFLKAVIAGIPALILLGAILWGMGAVLQALFPALIKMKILISFPN